MRQRAARVSPATLRQQYERDRSVAPAQVAFHDLRAAEDVAIEAAKEKFELVGLSPVLPFGAHACLGGLSQDRVLAALRSVEVAADTTMSLALEAAARWSAALQRDPRSSEEIHLAATQRVVRAQTFSGPRSFAHFSLFGLVSAGRDVGGQVFEARCLLEHVRVLVAVMRRAGGSGIVLRMTDFGRRHDRVLACVANHLPDDVAYERWDDRPAGRDYYPNVCFKIEGFWDDERIEVADGGIVNWSQRLIGSEKEHIVTSGLGLERIAALASAR